jgi:hemerythrin-like domain-containing protein
VWGGWKLSAQAQTKSLKLRAGRGATRVSGAPLTGVKTPTPAGAYVPVMNSCIESMVREHEVIVGVLASLQAMVDLLAAGGTAPRSDVAEFARFFGDFADKCHHGKEEDRLFVTMVEAGFPQEAGPIAVMLAEHGAGREEVRGLREVGAGTGPLSEAEKARVVGYARQFVPLLYAHIQKENNILYPMAQNAIAPEELERLDRSCEAFDEEIRSQLNVPELEQLAVELARRYPSDPAQLLVHGGCGARAAA